jgi:hypothetical protein
MPRYLNPDLTVAQAGPILERELRTQIGDEYDRLYRTIALQTGELTTNEEDQILGIIGLIGTTQDQTNLFLALTWLSKKEMRGQQAQTMLEEVRNKTVRQVLQQARQAVGHET